MLQFYYMEIVSLRFMILRVFRPAWLSDILICPAISCTVCPRCLDTFFTVIYCIKWVKTSWSYTYMYSQKPSMYHVLKRASNMIFARFGMFIHVRAKLSFNHLIKEPWCGCIPLYTVYRECSYK